MAVGVGSVVLVFRSVDRGGSASPRSIVVVAPVVTSHPSDTHQIRKKVSAKFLLEFEFKGTITRVPSLPSAPSTSPSASHSASPSEEQTAFIGVALGSSYTRVLWIQD